METIKDSDFISALLPLVTIIFIIGVGVVLLYQHFQKNLFIQKLKQETLKNVHQKELLRSNIEAQEEERKRIAQDLHDELGGVLAIMRMNLVMMEQENESKSNTKLSDLQNVRQLSEAALSSMRNISHRLMPPQLEAFGLVKTLQSVAEQINNSGAIYIELNTPPSMKSLSGAINISLYRIIMELINNTTKHSGATEISIDLDIKNQQVTCIYSDNGKGITSENMNKGIGHKSIDSRIGALGGTFNIDYESNSGFQVSIGIPL